MIRACDLLMGRDEYAMRWIKAYRTAQKAAWDFHSSKSVLSRKDNLIEKRGSPCQLPALRAM